MRSLVSECFTRGGGGKARERAREEGEGLEEAAGGGDMVGWEGGLVGAMFAGAWGVKVVLIWIVGVVLVVRV